ncbi:MAG: UDP-glucose/GDP-mannose dehydrogenase family protein [Nitrospira sp.]|nr:MAG: UDP-glucose/GDP-mannose dehydrogenase family protein [Nitrospira sp.]
MSHAVPTGFVGLSHLGIVSSLAWASFGRAVVAYDPSVERVASLAAGTLPVHEPGLAELHTKTHAHVEWVSDAAKLEACPLVIVSLDVPTAEDNTSDLTPVLALIDAIVPFLRQDVVLVVMSQVPPGFTRRLRTRIEQIRPDLRCTLHYWVETLIFGRAVERALRPERCIVGCEDSDAGLAPMFAEALSVYGCPILPMRYESAELAKTAINLYLIASVSYANTLADLCEAVDADWGEIVPALRLDQRIGPAAYLRPSLGIAGGNLERDLVTLRSLAYEEGVDAAVFDGFSQANKKRYDWALRMVNCYVMTQSAKPKIAVWGLTYKKNTHSTKNAPALRLIRDLAAHAEFAAWDPIIRAQDNLGAVQLLGSPADALRGADALLIMSDWDEFVNADLRPVRSEMTRSLVIDCAGALEGRRKELTGIEYVSMGRRPQGLRPAAASA